MKKIITLLLAAGAFVTVQAQTSKEESRRVILGQPKNGGTQTTGQTPSTNGQTSTTKQGRDVILGGGNEVSQYPGYPNEYPTTTKSGKKAGHSKSKAKKAKSNNGKHLGWEKGVGNPHRTGAVTNQNKGKGKGKK